MHLGNNVEVEVEENGEYKEVVGVNCILTPEEIEANGKAIDIGKENADKVRKTINDYKVAVEKSGKIIPFEHTIELTDDVPVSEQPRRLAHGLREPIAQALDMLQKNDFIEESSSAYSSPIIPVVKKNGEVRIAIDYRRLNKKTIPRRFPIPHPQDLIEKVRGSYVFSVLDLKQAYLHVPLKKSDRTKTAFVILWGKYRWKKVTARLIGSTVYVR